MTKDQILAQFKKLETGEEINLNVLTQNICDYVQSELKKKIVVKKKNVKHAGVSRYAEIAVKRTVSGIIASTSVNSVIRQVNEHSYLPTNYFSFSCTGDRRSGLTFGVKVNIKDIEAARKYLKKYVPTACKKDVSVLTDTETGVSTVGFIYKTKGDRHDAARYIQTHLVWSADAVSLTSKIVTTYTSDTVFSKCFHATDFSMLADSFPNVEEVSLEDILTVVCTLSRLSEYRSI